MTIVEALDNRSDQRRGPKVDRASFIAQTFSHALERVKTVGGRIDIFNLVLDADGAYHTYSQLSSYRDPQLLNRSLELFIEAFTPEPEGQTLTNRAIFDGVANRMEDPDEIIRKSHADIRIWRWPTLEDNTFIGIETVTDQRGESVRTWFVEGTKPAKPKKSITKFLFS